MIESLRAFATSWAAKVLLVLMIASFAVFGVQLAGFGAVTLGEVDNEEITVREFSRAYRERIEGINYARRQAGVSQPITPQQAMGANVHQNVLLLLGRRAALAQEAERVGIEFPDDALRRWISDNPEFHGANGFDNDAYLAVLRREGYRTETEFEKQRRRDLSVALLGGPLALGVSAPKAAGLALWRRENETRKIGYITLTEQQIPTPEDPGDDVLKAYHQTEAARFTQPEYRQLDVLVLDPEEFADPSAIDEERLRRAYDSAGARYNTPEQRNLQRLDFDTLQAAKAAQARAGRGASLQDIASELAQSDGGDLGAPPDFVDHGYTTRERLAGLSPEIAAAAFADGADGVLDPIQVGDRYVLLRVAGVIPGRSTPFESVRDQIALSLALESSRREMQQLANEIDNSIAGGVTFDELAEQRGVRLVRAEVDQAGLDREGVRAEGLPQDPNFLPTAFIQPQGVEIDLTPGPGGVFWTVVTTELTPAALRPFEEARGDVLADYRQAERVGALETLAEDAARRINEGEALEAVAADLGVDSRTAEGVRRGGGGGGGGGGDGGLPRSAVQAVFAVSAEQAVGSALTAPDGEDRLVMATLAVETPDAVEADEAIEAQRDALSRSIAQDLQLMYERAVETRFAPEYNLDALNRVAAQFH